MKHVDTALAGHADIKQQGINGQRGDALNRFHAVSGFADDGDGVFHLQQGADALPDEQLIIGNENPDHEVPLRRGSMAVKPNPLSG